ncbi:MAG: transglycosylase SLT domain-containing protein [Pyrinomonadaceae bacterium]
MKYKIAATVIAVLLGIFALVFAASYANQYWIHRYDELIARQSLVYGLDEKLVWSIINEESYFSAWKIGADDEVGLMQVTPLVAREWAKTTGLEQFEQRVNADLEKFLRDPERNIQVGCWYLESLRTSYRGYPAEIAMTLAAYNAGPSRVTEWTKTTDIAKISESEFINRIDIPSTKSYVTSILEHYREN